MVKLQGFVVGGRFARLLAYVRGWLIREIECFVVIALVGAVFVVSELEEATVLSFARVAEVVVVVFVIVWPLAVEWVVEVAKVVVVVAAEVVVVVVVIAVVFLFVFVVAFETLVVSSKGA